jgi:AcrR family transcriptional regulator
MCVRRSLPADTEEARDHLLATAEGCFERYGIERTTMDDVAAAAKVSRPTLYKYFGDRDSLIRSIAIRRSKMMVDRVQKFIARYDRLEDKLVEGLVFLADKGRRDQFYKLLLREETIDMANKLLMAEGGAATTFATEVWGPVLDAAGQRGELKEGLDRSLAYYWLTSVNFTLIGWFDLDGKPLDRHREMLRLFVVPAFLP